VTGARSAITASDQPGNGTFRSWTRTIGGRTYAFTAVLIPDGERRYVARKLTAGQDPQLGRSWRHAGFWMFPA
jgi:hypothetical protein